MSEELPIHRHDRDISLQRHSSETVLCLACVLLGKATTLCVIPFSSSNYNSDCLH